MTSERIELLRCNLKHWKTNSRQGLANIFATVLLNNSVLLYKFRCVDLSKALQILLRDTTEQNDQFRRKIENQKTQLKNLNSKRNQVALLNNEVNKLKQVLKAEKDKTRLARASDIQQYKMQINDLELKIRIGKEFKFSQRKSKPFSLYLDRENATPEVF